MSKFFRVVVMSAVVVVIVFASGYQRTTAVPQDEIRVTGYGVASQDMRHPGQKKLMGRMAAIADGYWNLACILEDMRVSADTKMRDYMIESHDVYLSIDAFIKGAKIVSEREVESGIYEVEMTLPLEGKKGLFEEAERSGVAVAPAPPEKRQHTAIQLTVKMRGINPVAKIYVNKQEILKYNKSSQYIYYDYLKIYDDSDEHEISLEAQTYGYKNYVVFKKKDGEVLLEKKLTVHAGEYNEYVCIAEFDYWSLECHNTNPRGYTPEY
ncbi:hypothetical protein ACFLQK_02435 [bacterium]